MKQFLNTGIKEVLEKYPELGPILKEYDINCYKCDGNCLTKDIHEEHNLSLKQEMELKKKMGRILDNNPNDETSK